MEVHALDRGHRIDLENMEVLRRVLPFTPQRLIAEPVEITKHHSVNRIEGELFMRKRARYISGVNLMTGRSMTRTQSQHLDCSCLGLGNLVGGMETRHRTLNTYYSLFYHEKITSDIYDEYGSMTHSSEKNRNGMLQWNCYVWVFRQLTYLELFIIYQQPDLLKTQGQKPREYNTFNEPI
ncbi:hypothetical protein CSKR_100670 [Clonorchis sinensis]|uniref:Uncharacterized protein n=1 Tax=Clonorchis sinensis TaxID=79923 RepID=A0A3R7F860_CLOSI|nr:hypothetical protein CSKR_100670 [Clonorchis sinensis]